MIFSKTAPIQHFSPKNYFFLKFSLLVCIPCLILAYPRIVFVKIYTQEVSEYIFMVRAALEPARNGPGRFQAGPRPTLSETKSIFSAIKHTFMTNLIIDNIIERIVELLIQL